MSLDFYKNKNVFITGHTGFKGTWVSHMLALAGANITGYALPPAAGTNLYTLCKTDGILRSIIADVRDFSHLLAAVKEAKPDFVLHLAAQPLVREGYANPRETFEVNVMGTVNLLEALRHYGHVSSVLNVTTDKVYQNREWDWGYRENDALNGRDPYANSKSCSELVTQSYAASFFTQGCTAVSTARAGNVIGGGDFAPNRIVPDCVRAATKGVPVVLRNPDAVRPYQHVLEPLHAYLKILQCQQAHPQKAGCYNIGPDSEGCVTTQQLVQMFCHYWGVPATWVAESEDTGPHEAKILRLDCSKIKNCLGWRQIWGMEEAVKNTVEWYKTYHEGGDVRTLLHQQIQQYYAGAGE